MVKLLALNEERTTQMEKPAGEYHRQGNIAPAVVRAVEQQRRTRRTILPGAQVMVSGNVEVREKVPETAPQALCQEPSQHWGGMLHVRGG